MVIYKTKVSKHEDRRTVAFFHTSNGVLVPEGFDRARDVLEIAERFDVVTKSGSWLAHGRRKLGQGLDNAVVKLTDHPEWLGEIEAQVRSKFRTQAVPVINASGDAFVEGTGEVVE